MANPYRNTGKAGSPAHFIGPIGRAFVKGAKAFGNTAKQYYNMFTLGARVPKAVNQQTTRNFKPFHRDGKTYSTEDINNVFKKRFSKGAVPNKEILKKNKPSMKDLGMKDPATINREAPDPRYWK